ncbi:MAG: 2'-5' RNA ligase family protein [Eubacteriales bacterium]|nr:2'-5' RNA ligase family protein [Eubacteriales bacterium]
MDGKRLYLVALLDRETEQKLDAVTRNLTGLGLCENPQISIPFHITLADFEPALEAQVVHRVREVCTRLAPFTLQLSHIGLFGLKVLFAAPAVNRELLELHDALAPQEPATGAHAWVPHVTLLIDEPEGNISKAVPIVAEMFAPTKARVESVAVYEYPPARFVGKFHLDG